MSGAHSGLVLISGYAKLPANITSEEVFKTLVVVVLVDMQLGTITDAECSVVTEVSKKFISGILIGYNLASGPDALIERFEKSYFGQTKKAIIASLKMIFEKYSELERSDRDGK